jgi:hypothetical protein
VWLAVISGAVGNVVVCEASGGRQKGKQTEGSINVASFDGVSFLVGCDSGGLDAAGWRFCVRFERQTDLCLSLQRSHGPALDRGAARRFVI